MTMKLYCSYTHSPSIYQDLAGDRSRSGPQHRSSPAVGVKEGQAHFGRHTEVRDTVTLIPKKRMAHNRGDDT
jgi:hypothetical protein